MAKVTSSLPIFFSSSIEHNETKNIQGGNDTERYHLTAEELAKVNSGGAYTNLTPTIAPIGGYDIGSTFNERTNQQMWDGLLYPELEPSLSNPDNSFGFNYGGLYEVGQTVGPLSFTAGFYRGAISPAYGTSGNRSGLPEHYNYGGPGLPPSVDSDLLSDNESVASHIVTNGTNSWSNSVTYLEGEQPMTSAGNEFASELPAGTTGLKYVSLTGTYPVFYGKSGSAPVANQDLINSGSKLVVQSDGTVNITFGASTEYIWFAIPIASTDKTKWYVDALNNGNIGSPSDLFNNEVIVSVDSPTILWSGIQYKIYLSNYATSTSGNMQLQN